MKKEILFFDIETEVNPEAVNLVDTISSDSISRISCGGRLISA